LLQKSSMQNSILSILKLGIEFERLLNFHQTKNNGITLGYDKYFTRNDSFCIKINTSIKAQ